MAETLMRDRVRPPPSAPQRDAGASRSDVPHGAGGSNTRRDRLREFQTSLSERLRRAQSVPIASNRLGLQIGAHRVLVDLVEAGEILAIPPITSVPLVKPWYRGLANVRGNLLGIVDLSLFAGGEATPLDTESRVLAFGSELRFVCGILVSRMLGLRSAADLEPVDAGAADEAPSPYAPWLRARLVDAQGVHWDELDLAALVADERFLRVERS